ncbi:hypothetical protein GIB67_027626 [Kingdonia uniflora]|uniref:NPH3 domain-containing protein n=1 Tax=Kingdonia uniflora TaxID=39325 RepID=A0A7J7NLM4_9MAGN|nr:hypothetical protein GIB67_027626 [Kingdonia uniflora]
MNCQKLSLEACTHAAQNERLPLRVVVQVLFFEQLRLRTSIAGWFFVNDNLENSRALSGNLALPSNDGATQADITNDGIHGQVVGISDMRLRASELEKECLGMKQKLEKFGKTKSSWNIFSKFGCRRSNATKSKASKACNSKAPPPTPIPLVNEDENYEKVIMVRTRRMVYEEKASAKMCKLKLRYFGDQSVAMPTPIPDYRRITASNVGGVSASLRRTRLRRQIGADVSARQYRRYPTKEWIIRMYRIEQVIESRGKNIFLDIEYIAEVRKRIFKMFGYDYDLPESKFKFEGLYSRARELEIGRHFYSEIFREVILEPVARKEAMRQIVEEEIEEENARIAGGELISWEKIAETESRRWLYNNVVKEGFGASSDSYLDVEESNLILKLIIGMETSIDMETSTSSYTVETKHGEYVNVESEGEDEVVPAQFLDFPDRLVSYPPNSGVFREFCKSKALVGGIWGNVVEHTGRGVDKSISLEYFDENVQGDLDEGFLCYLSQLEYGLSLPHCNLAKGIINIIRDCLAQLNGNIWKVILVCESLYRLWEENEVEGRISPEDILQYYGVKNYSATGGTYFCSSSSRPLFFNLNLAGRMWNNNVIWVKGDCLQREDEEPMKLLYRTVKKSPQSKVMNESMLDTVAQEGVKLEIVLKELGIKRNKRANNRFEKVQKSQMKKLMTGAEASKKRGADGEKPPHLLKATDLDFTDVPKATMSSKLVMKFSKKKTGKRGSASGTTGSDELRAVEDRVRLAARKGTEEMSAYAQLKLGKMTASLLKGICLRIEEGKTELKNGKVELEKRTRAQLLLVRYSKAEVRAIMDGTYIEEDEVEENVPGVVGGLDGVSPRTELENQGEDNEKVELESTRLSEQETLQYNQEYVVEFDRIREANEDREDQYVKVHFKFVEATQIVDDLTRKIEEKDAKIKKGQKELAEAKEKTKKLKSQNDVLMVKSKEADMARYSKSEIAVDQLSESLLAKDTNFWMVQRRCDKLNERVAQLMADLATANLPVRKAEAGGWSKKKKARIKAHVQRGNEYLRESQGKLDIALGRERELEGVIRGKDQLIGKKDELLKKSPAGKSTGKDKELEELRAQLPELSVTSKAEQDKAAEKVAEHNVIMSHAEEHMTRQYDRYKDLQECYQRLKKHFSQEVRRLEFERDTLHDYLSGRGCICKVDVYRGNCMNAMEIEFDSRPAELVE